jgi:hypothetical protein
MNWALAAIWSKVRSAAVPDPNAARRKHRETAAGADEDTCHGRKTTAANAMPPSATAEAIRPKLLSKPSRNWVRSADMIYFSPT